MNHIYFNKLTKLVQFQITLQKAVLVAEFTNGSLKFQLFSLADFYVEIQSKIDNCRITQIVAFADNVLLTPYLERIDISGIFDCT